VIYTEDVVRVREIPVNERSVFEPACGHAAFLISAMRLLTDLLPPDRAILRWMAK
jgi:hypothetical protein